VRGDQLPLSVDLHPDIGEPVAIVKAFPGRLAPLVIGAGDNGCIAMHSNLDVEKLCGLYVLGRFGRMTDETYLAERAAVFHGDDVVIGNQRRENVDLSGSIRVRPFHFKRTNGDRICTFLGGRKETPAA